MSLEKESFADAMLQQNRTTNSFMWYVICCVLLFCTKLKFVASSWCVQSDWIVFRIIVMCIEYICLKNNLRGSYLCCAVHIFYYHGLCLGHVSWTVWTGRAPMGTGSIAHQTRCELVIHKNRWKIMYFPIQLLQHLWSGRALPSGMTALWTAIPLILSNSGRVQ